MDLSVIIVNWNGVDILRDCLASVFENLGGASTEVLVVDNASTDGSADMVEREFTRGRLIRNVENRGFAAANNQAFREARGRYVLLLNSDTVVLGDVFQRSVDYMDAHLDVGAMGCRVLNPDRTMQPTCFRYPSLLNLALWATGLTALPGRFFGRERFRGWNRDTERDVDVVTGCYLMIPREVIAQVGLLDENFFFFGEETDWCRRISQAGWKVRFAPVGEIIHIGNASGEGLGSQRALMLAAGLVRYQRKHSGVFVAFASALLLAAGNLGLALRYRLRSLFRNNEELRTLASHHWVVARKSPIIGLRVAKLTALLGVW